MAYRLSLLDKSLVQRGEHPAAALARTVALAKHAETLGYHRFWLAEHHGFKTHASSAPEILIAHILAQTARIRVGSGGVMLQHYSAYKVAETFNMLAGLSPGRVDLGVGKAPGGFPLSTRALQAQEGGHAVDFAEQLGALDGYLGAAPGALAMPLPQVAPERHLLGASVASAVLAGERGWDFVFAGQFNGDSDLIEASFAAYRRYSDRPPMLAVVALAAPTQGEAEAKVAAMRMFKMHLPHGQSVNPGSPDQAVEYARQAGVSDYTVEEIRPSLLAGTPDFIHARFERMQARFGVEEFIIDTPVATEADRRTSIDLLAQRQTARVP
ncbi:MAG: MsnO8 family LLM class oxidoreductase [Alphaproteobacteria bacterium]|nr:MsnO8 family LLM class oxidoreductase [Alphaproteobacteria bacterium]